MKAVCGAGMASGSSIEGEEWGVEGQIPSSRWEQATHLISEFPHSSWVDLLTIGNQD